MKPTDLSKLGYDTEGFVPGGDYVPNVFTADDGTHTELVMRGFQQLEQLNGLGGVNVLGGSAEALDAIYGAIEEGMDLVTAVELFGDEIQKLRAHELIAAGQVTD